MISSPNICNANDRLEEDVVASSDPRSRKFALWVAQLEPISEDRNKLLKSLMFDIVNGVKPLDSFEPLLVRRNL